MTTHHDEALAALSTLYTAEDGSREKDVARDAVEAALTAPGGPVAGDEHHSMDALYEYRMLYNAHAAHGWLLAGLPVVKSWRHSDGEACFGGGWFIVVATLPTGQVSNHYAAEHWDLFQVPAVDLPPEYDGHTPQDAAARLRVDLARQRPPACCGACPAIVGGGYDCTCAGNPRGPLGRRRDRERLDGILRGKCISDQAADAAIEQVYGVLADALLEQHELDLAMHEAFRPEVVAEVAVHLSEESDWDAIAAWCGGTVRNTEALPSGEVESYIDLPGVRASACTGMWIVQRHDLTFDVRAEVAGPSDWSAEALAASRAEDAS